MTEAGAIAAALSAWYGVDHRDLPWRTDPPQPWPIFVSEAMLQQTQVATVVPYFRRFLREFPTPAALAGAEEQQLMARWQGLGYYRRARNLQAAARLIVERHNGAVPRDPAALLALPGVGRYTAGAVASLAFGLPEPILDGNVIRVLCRLNKIEADSTTAAVQRHLWSDATALVRAAESPAVLNSALMELGATVCTPRSPKCLACPVREWCRGQLIADRLPTKKPKKPTPLIERDVWCVRDAAGCYALHQRPITGRWPGLWQFVTLEKDERPPGIQSGVLLGEVRHALTHRRYRFRAFHALGKVPGEKVPPARFGDHPMSKPQLKIAGLVRAVEHQ